VPPRKALHREVAEVTHDEACRGGSIVATGGQRPVARDDLAPLRDACDARRVVKKRAEVFRAAGPGLWLNGGDAAVGKGAGGDAHGDNGAPEENLAVDCPRRRDWLVYETLRPWELQRTMPLFTVLNNALHGLKNSTSP
jgi:hypothetical protein